MNSWLRFDLIAASSAQDYVHHIERRASARLSDLAHHMADTGGPIELMDASFESLVPLWAWFQQQLGLGLPGVPDVARPSRVRFFGFAPDPVDRALFAAEPMSHYLFEIIRTSADDARWVVDTSVPKSTEFQRPVVLANGWSRVPAEQLPSNSASALARRAPGTQEPTRFRDIVDRIYHFTEHEVRFSHSNSILEPLLAQPRIPDDDPSRMVPSAVEAERVNLHPERKAGGGAGEGWVIADRHADVLEPERARPLKEAVLAAELSRLGWHIDGVPVTVSALRDNDSQIVLRDEMALMEPFAFKGRLRLLSIDTVNISDAEFAQMENDLRMAATAVGAHYGESTDFEGTSR